MLEQLKYAKRIWLQPCVCINIMWVGGAYESGRWNNPREDQIFMYVAPTLVECMCVKIPFARYVEQVSMT